MKSEIYSQWKRDGRCTICGGVTVFAEVGFGARTRCLRCAARDAFYRERQYRKCINSGLCVRCGKRPARPNRTTCAVCAKRQKATYLKRLWGTELKGEKHDQ